jgi:hypothetical protein
MIMRNQKGYTFWSLGLTIVGVVFVAIIAMKLVPAYIEYFTIKKVMVKIKNELATNPMSKQEIITSFNHSSAVDDIKSIKATDLEIAKDADGATTVSVEYQVVVPLVGNVSALLDFDASTAAVAEAKE